MKIPYQTILIQNNMIIRITVENLDTEGIVEKNYEFNDTDYVTKPWELIIPELIDQATNEDEAF